MDSKSECIVCYNENVACGLTILPCMKGDTFICNDCLVKIVKDSKFKCPHCRAEYSTEVLSPDVQNRVQAAASELVAVQAAQRTSEFVAARDAQRVARRTADALARMDLLADQLATQDVLAIQRTAQQIARRTADALARMDLLQLQAMQRTAAVEATMAPY